VIMRSPAARRGRGLMASTACFSRACSWCRRRDHQQILLEVGATHERAGQLAMGVVVLEDVVAVMMLTLLNSIVQFGSVAGGAVKIGETLGMLGAFVVLAGIVGCCWCPGCCGA